VSVEQFEVVYCEGWEPAGRAIVGPIQSEAALSRYESGEQFAVLVLARGKPCALLEISWRHHSCVAWGLDQRFRRRIKRDFRRIDDEQLLLVEEIEWRYSSPQQQEFDPSAPRQTTWTRIRRADSGIVVTTNDGGLRVVDVPHSALRLGVPAFGDWGPLLFGVEIANEAEVGRSSRRDELLAELAQLSGDPDVWRLKPILSPHQSTVRLEERIPPPPRLAVAPLVEPVWRPPCPMQPDQRVLRLAGPPRSVALGGRQLLIESYRAGRLRLPTGHVVGCAPDDRFIVDLEPYTVSVAPGAYDFFLNIARVTEGPGMDPRVAAAGVLIREEPVTSWELALMPGEDPRLLPEGEAFCFDVDGGIACLMDVVAIPEVARAFVIDENPLVETKIGGVWTGDFEDRASGANLIAFASGWGDGSYPVWVGRVASGVVAAFVADMCLFRRDAAAG
jgi:hypothetical protein